MGMADAIALGAMVFWIFLLCLILPRLRPKTSSRLLALIAVGSAAAAVGFFCLYRWAGYAILAYGDSITLGLIALLAALLLWQKQLSPGDKQLNPEERGPSEPVG